MYQVRDLAEAVRDYRDSLSDSAQELEDIEARLDVIHRLRRKYGADCTEILAYLDQARKELDEIEFSGDQVERLKGKLKKAEAEAQEKALALRESRKKASESLSQRLLQELRELDMPRVQFSCEFTKIPMGPLGADGVAFFMSANAGEALKPLSKVASGGELARIMLAMKNVLAQQDQVATLVFDEVDTGVSGRAAQKVGRKLRSVAENRQVLCVTHLPQIAALGQHHLLISKSEQNGRTFTTVTPLDHDGRVRELARIIAGEAVTEATLRSAEEMLKA